MSKTVTLHKNMSLRDALVVAKVLGVEVRQPPRGGHLIFIDPWTNRSFNRSQSRHDAGRGLVQFLKRATAVRMTETDDREEDA